MDEKKDVENLAQLFAAGDAWLRKFGLVASVAHNAIVANLYVNFPKVRYLEYFLPEEAGRRKVWVVLYIPFWKLLFTNRDRMIDEVITLLREYLSDYDIRVELKRYRKGVEKSNEIPKDALEHVRPDPVVLDDHADVRPVSEPKALSAGPAAPGDDQAGQPDPARDHAPGAVPEPREGDQGS